MTDLAEVDRDRRPNRHQGPFSHLLRSFSPARTACAARRFHLTVLVHGNNISLSRLFRKTCTRKTDTYHRKMSTVPFVLRMVRTPFSTLTTTWSAGSPETVTESFAFASSSARP